MIDTMEVAQSLLMSVDQTAFMFALTGLICGTLVSYLLFTKTLQY